MHWMKKEMKKEMRKMSSEDPTTKKKAYRLPVLHEIHICCIDFGGVIDEKFQQDRLSRGNVGLRQGVQQPVKSLWAGKSDDFDDHRGLLHHRRGEGGLEAPAPEIII